MRTCRNMWPTPPRTKIPVATLLSKEWAKQRAKSIDAERAKCDVGAGDLPGGSDTTYLSVVDREGNMVSLIQSNYDAFGSGIVAPGTGFALHNRGGAVSRWTSLRRMCAWRDISGRGTTIPFPDLRRRARQGWAFGDYGRIWNQSQAHARNLVADIGDFKSEHQAALEDSAVSKAYVCEWPHVNTGRIGLSGSVGAQ